LAVLHGGEINASSDGSGQGSKLRVILPLMQGQEQVRQAPKAITAERSPRNGMGKRVLLVEDNLDLAAGLRLVLMNAGYEVQVVNDGSSAIRAAEQDHPDAVVLDIGLPDLDGYEVAHRLRHQLELKHIPIIALSGYGSEYDRQRSREAGIDRHLIKPASLSDLEQALACRGNSP
jgi:CheY-like chemotaxis protein